MFIKLDINILHLLTFTDTSFANNKDLLLQIKYTLVLEDASYKANIIHWLLIKCKKVTRGVLALELYAMAYGFNIGAAIKSTIEYLHRLNFHLYFIPT